MTRFACIVFVVHSRKSHPQMTQMNADKTVFNLRLSASSADQHFKGILCS